MKFQVLIVLLLAVSISAKLRHTQDEEEGDSNRDQIMEYRILGKGTFSVASFPTDEDSKFGDHEPQYAQFPNYCKHQLDDAQFTSLSSKASTYLQCWHDVVESEVADMAGCEEALASCSEALAKFELSESENEGEEEEGDAVEEEPEEEEQEEEECEDGECDEEEEAESPEEVSDDSGEVFLREDVPLLTPIQATCYYYILTKNLENKDGSLQGQDLLETEGVEQKVFKELTFHQDLRTSISWLEFWLYMCNGDENVLLNFEANPLLSSTEKAINLYERLNPKNEEEEVAERKVVRQAKITKKAVKSHASKILKSKNFKKLVSQ